MIETTTLAAPTNGATAGIASGAVCGLTATTTAATSPTASGAALRRRPCAVSAEISGEGCGSSTATLAAARPGASHPSSMALPILPAPTSRTDPGRLASAPVAFDVVMALSIHPPRTLSPAAYRLRAPTGTRDEPMRRRLGLALGLEHGGVERLAR